MGSKYRAFALLSAVMSAASGASTAAHAGAFALREQDAFGQGASFAGVAAGGTPGSLFWNPAIMTQFAGTNSALSATLLIPRAEQQGNNNLPGVFGIAGGLDNTASSAALMSSATMRQIGERLWIGLSVSSPYGLSVDFERPSWAGAFYGQSTSLRTYNATPSVAYKLADWISVGVGFQAQYAQASLLAAGGIAAPGAINSMLVSGTGWGWGWTAGVTLTPLPATQIGVGYRSAVDQKIDGTFAALGGFATPGGASTTLALPDTVSAGIRQGLGNGLTLLGTVEWTNWSRIGTSLLTQPNGQPALAPSGTPVALPFDYRDGWFYSVGLEYALTSAWTLRGGIGYERTPISDDVRIPLLPDNDRIWFSVGASTQINSRVSVDLAYSYLDVKSTPISVMPGNPWYNGAVTYVGTVSSSVNILSVGVKVRWDEPPKPVVTKG